MTKKKTIFRKDGNNSIMEINTHSFAIDRMQFVFSKYNPNLPEGQRTTDRVALYLSFPEALEFAESVLDGNFAKELGEQSKQAQVTGNKYDANLTVHIGGNLHPKNRSDNKPEFRSLTATLTNNPKTKNPVALIGQIGPGKLDKGLIKPDGRSDHSVYITFSKKELREMAVMIRTHVNAFITSEHTKGVWEYQYNANNNSNNQASNQNNQNQNQKSNYNNNNNNQNQNNQNYNNYQPQNNNNNNNKRVTGSNGGNNYNNNNYYNQPNNSNNAGYNQQTNQQVNNNQQNNNSGFPDQLPF